MHKRASDSGKFRFSVLNAITHDTEFFKACQWIAMLKERKLLSDPFWILFHKNKNSI